MEVKFPIVLNINKIRFSIFSKDFDDVEYMMSRL